MLPDLLQGMINQTEETGQVFFFFGGVGNLFITKITMTAILLSLIVKVVHILVLQ